MRLAQGRTVLTRAAAFVLPSMTGRTHDVDHALCLRRLPVPCWAMAPGLGHEAMSWDRLEHGGGRCRCVGTTGKSPEPCPKDLVAEAKQRWWHGARGSSAPTAAHDGLLGASVAPSASQVDGAKA
jgi:ribosome modulation factor